MQQAPELPRLYELARRGEVDSAMAEARRLALDGAEEGTLVWASSERAAVDRLREPVPSPDGNFYSALVMRPDDPPPVAAQLYYAAALAARQTLAGVVPVLGEVRFRWPDELTLNERRVGTLSLELPRDDAAVPAWMLLGVTVHVNVIPEGAEESATSLVAEDSPKVSEGELLGRFGRYFLTWAHTWAHDGFAPLRTTWLRHALGVGEDATVPLPGGTVSGRLADLDQEGSAVVELASGEARRISLLEAFTPADDAGAGG